MSPRRTWHTCQPVDLFSLARKQFLQAQRPELQKLARELGISRATAYRWAGSADELIGDVLASLVDDTFARIVERTQSTGSDRVLEVVERGMRAAHRFEPLRRFLTRDPQAGLRILASKHGPVQRRTIANLETLIDEEISHGNMTISIEPAVMAYALTRIVESFLYADLITDAKPDLESASEIVRLLLRPAA